MTQFNISVTSDTVCPWCYVGKKRLERGIAAYKEAHPDAKDDTFSITWLPFYLNPDASKSIDKQAYYHSKFGEERTAMMQARLAAIGREEGIHFAFGGRTGNTRQSHRLVQLAKNKGEHVQTRTVEELFAAYFENEKDITDNEVLIAAGVKAGLDEDEVRKVLLEGDEFGPLVDREVMRAKAGQINGVPNFNIQDMYEVSGAQEPAAFVQLFEKVKTRESKA